MKSILNINNLTISFGGLHALENVSFSVYRSEIVSIIGPNGAGKSTLFNCISRIYTPASGSILFCDKNLLELRPHEIPKIGIARTFQNIELFSHMTVLENLLVAKDCSIKSGIISDAIYLGKTKRKEKAIREEIEDIIDFFKLSDVIDEDVENLPYGYQKYVELARAISLEPKLMLLDEPTAGLSVYETNELRKLILNTKEKFDMTILLVEHNVNFVESLSDKIIVLDYGKKLAEGSPEYILNNPSVIEAYLGKDENVASSQ